MRHYHPPLIAKIKLEFEQALLAVCSVDGAFFVYNWCQQTGGLQDCDTGVRGATRQTGTNATAYSSQS